MSLTPGSSNKPELIKRLYKLESAVVADVMVKMGLEQQVLSPSFLPLASDIKIAGPAICAKGSIEAGKNAKPTFELDHKIYSGGIVVIDSGDCKKGALIGDNMATSMTKKGAIGFIVDGGIRDTETFIEQKLPVFYKYSSPINAHKFFSFTDFEVDISVDGIWGSVTICPGDLIIADMDGIAVIPLSHAEQIIHDSEIHLETENSIKSALLQGSDREEVTLQANRLEHVHKLK